MRTLQIFNSFRARLVLLLVVLLGLTLGVQYYVNLQSVKRNAHMLVEQEQAIFAGVALGVNSINSPNYLDQMRNDLREPLIDEKTGRVKNHPSFATACLLKLLLFERRFTAHFNFVTY